MKVKVAILGMTCGGCKATVEKALLSLKSVSKVEIDLEKEEGIIHMAHLIEIEALQNAVPSKFSISLKPLAKTPTGDPIEITDNISEKTKVQQLKPLFLILLYIVVASVLMHFKNWSWSEFMLDFMGLFYIVFSFFKMLDLKGFPESFQMYDPLAKRVPVYARVYPFIETALGLLFLMRVELQIALILTLIILGITTIGVTKTLLSKKSIRCACLGTALKLPMSEATFIENAIMIVMALAMLLGVF